jgi:UDP-N-acetylmuramyl tripeptide synthase
VAIRAGLAAGWLSRRLGLGAGVIIGGRVTLALAPSALSRLAAGRLVVLVSGTNGKTTTSHLLAAALRTAGRVAHNASGANMADGAVAALAADPDAPVAVLEIDELHLAAVAAAVDPAVVVLLNLSRDQLDRGCEVRAVAAAVGGALAAHPRTVTVANADDPMVVWAATQSPRPSTVWVSTRGRWNGDATSCPRCGTTLHGNGDRWRCRCGLARPAPHWEASEAAAVTRDGLVIPVGLRLPGRFNLGNAVTAMAAAELLGVDPRRAAAAMSLLPDVAGRYAVVTYRERELRLLLAKNPAGWAEILGVLDEARPLLVVVNAREADGRDTSWLWDVPFDEIAGRRVVAAGEHAADVGVRLTYAEIEHDTVADPLAGLALLPTGVVDVVANYTAFHQLRRRLTAETAGGEPTK